MAFSPFCSSFSGRVPVDHGSKTMESNENEDDVQRGLPLQIEENHISDSINCESCSIELADSSDSLVCATDSWSALKDYLTTHIRPDFGISIPVHDLSRVRTSFASKQNDKPLFAGFRVRVKVPTFDELCLSDSALRMLLLPNAGGSSELSEALSFELLHTLFPQIELRATEMEIQYKSRRSPRTDYAVRLGNEFFGVSVCRAYSYCGAVFGVHEARRLLEKKLHGILSSTAQVLPSRGSCPRWKRQILHILAENRKTVRVLRRQWRKLPKSLRANTIVLVSAVCDLEEVFTQRKLDAERVERFARLAELNSSSSSSSTSSMRSNSGFLTWDLSDSESFFSEDFDCTSLGWDDDEINWSFFFGT